MDLRLYTKSGNDYYIDISNYGYQDILRDVTDAMDRGDVLTLENSNEVKVIKCKELEYFEIIRNDEEEDKEVQDYEIGFKA